MKRRPTSVILGWLPSYRSDQIPALVHLPCTWVDTLAYPDTQVDTGNLLSAPRAPLRLVPIWTCWQFPRGAAFII